MTLGPLRWSRTNVLMVLKVLKVLILMVLMVFIVLVLKVLILFSLHPSIPYLRFASQQKMAAPMGLCFLFLTN